MTTMLRAQTTVELWYGRPHPGPEELLAPEERQRAAQIRSSTARAEFVAARTWLRCILAGYTRASASSLRFSYGRWGKPRLVDHDLEFSVSHADGVVLVAVCASAPVGVDVEQLRPGVWDPTSSALVCSPSELETIAAAPDPDRTFLEVWTRKEAFAKMSGEGLVDRLTAVDLLTGPVDGIEVRSLYPEPDVVAAVACRQGAVTVWRTR